MEGASGWGSPGLPPPLLWAPPLSFAGPEGQKGRDFTSGSGPAAPSQGQRGHPCQRPRGKLGASSSEDPALLPLSLHTRMVMCTQSHMHTGSHPHVHTSAPTNSRAHTHTSLHPRTHTSTHTDSHSQTHPQVHTGSPAHQHTHMHTHMCTHRCAHTHTCTEACSHTRIPALTDTCTLTHTLTHAQAHSDAHTRTHLVATSLSAPHALCHIPPLGELANTPMHRQGGARPQVDGRWGPGWGSLRSETWCHTRLHTHVRAHTPGTVSTPAAQSQQTETGRKKERPS